MQPLNPFLAAFFKSSVASQCTPVHHYILLVPQTDVLLTHRETESGSSTSDIVATEEFLASHVLRIPPGGKEAQNLREVRGKAKQFSTLNGRSVIVKDAFIYSNKGKFIREIPDIANRRRLQVAGAGANTKRRDVVPRRIRSEAMAAILYFETLDRNMGRD